MGVSVDQIRVIARGAFLHDVGKMAISDGILRKPGPLTDQETAMMREHCLRGPDSAADSLSSPKPSRSCIAITKTTTALDIRVV
jgi:HD-GYP domain-containing protein (c-di-GMP phosphodiesterase class II)